MVSSQLSSPASQWWPAATSTIAPQIDSLFVWIALVVGVWLVLSELALVLFLWRARARSRHPLPAAPTRLREEWWILGLACAVLACDLGIEAYGHPIWRSIVAGAPSAALPVSVEARQFAWTIRHPGRDEQLGTEDDIELQNELHVPVGRPVELRLRSVDVIHSFFLPSMRLKQDVLPGQEVRRWFVATYEGTFPIACAELCGFAHYRMGGQIVVHNPLGYRDWLRSALDPHGAVGANEEP